MRLMRLIAVLCVLALPARALEVGAVGGPNPQLWPAYIGNAHGMFGAVGKLDFVFAPSSAAVMQQIAAGSLPMSASSGLADPIRAAAQGANVAIVRIDGQSAPYALLSKPAIKAMADLKGRIIMIGGAKDITRVYLERMLAPSGIKPGQYDLVYAGATSQRYAALTSGAVDAAILYPPFMFRGVAAGYVNLGTVVEYAPDLPFSGLTANRAWASANRAALQAVIDGYTTAIAWLQDPAHREEAIAMMVELSKSDRKDIEDTFDFLQNIHFFAPGNDVSRHKLDTIVSVLKADGDIPASTTIEQLVLPGVTNLSE